MKEEVSEKKTNHILGELHFTQCQ